MDIFHYFKLFKKYKLPLFLIFSFALISAVISFKALTKKYKSVGSISISIRYFQNPLIRDFVTETYDNQEIRAQREALIIGAISDDFIDAIAEKYKLYDHEFTLNSQEHFYQRSLLRKKIEIVPVNPSTSQISFYSNNPKVSHEVLKMVITQIEKYLKIQRQKNLVSLRASMKKRIDVLMASIDYSIDINQIDSEFSRNPILIGERDKLKAEIQENLKFYNNKHPVLEKLNKKLLSVEEQIRRATQIELKPNQKSQNINTTNIEKETESIGRNDQNKMPESDELLLSNSPNLIKAKNVVYEDLVRKFEYLNIAINSETPDSSSYLTVLQNPTYPLDYIFPNKAFFILWAIIGAFFISAIYIALFEGLVKLKRKDISSYEFIEDQDVKNNSFSEDLNSKSSFVKKEDLVSLDQTVNLPASKFNLDAETLASYKLLQKPNLDFNSDEQP